LGLALDEPKENDATFEHGGIKFLLDNELSNQCGVIKVDFIDAGPRSGFAISPAKPLNTGGSSCGSSCGTGGSCGC
jgi:Fe-S cluster assembly iron-binding protein IscA